MATLAKQIFIMKTLLSLLAVTLVISSCKNGWTDSDRTEFINTCATAAAPNMGQDKAKAYCSCMQQKLEVKYPNSSEASKAINAPGAMQTPEMTAMVQACLNGGNTNNNNNNNGNGGGVLGGGGNNNGGGMGGNWSADDEQKFMNTCLQNATNAGADRQTANAHCNCTLKKIEAKYSSYNEANTKMTTQEMNQMEQDCNANNNGGGNGNGNENGNGNGNGGGVIGGGDNNNMGGAWSANDEQKFMNTCIQNATNAGADRQLANTHCNCTLKKIEAKYHSYDEANTKMTTQEVNAIEQQCIQERNGNN